MRGLTSFLCDRLQADNLQDTEDDFKKRLQKGSKNAKQLAATAEEETYDSGAQHDALRNILQKQVYCCCDAHRIHELKVATLKAKRSSQVAEEDITRFRIGGEWHILGRIRATMSFGHIKVKTLETGCTVNML